MIEQLSSSLELETSSQVCYPRSWDLATIVVTSLRGRNPPMSLPQLKLVLLSAAWVASRVEDRRQPPLVRLLLKLASIRNPGGDLVTNFDAAVAASHIQKAFGNWTSDKAILLPVARAFADPKVRAVLKVAGLPSATPFYNVGSALMTHAGLEGEGLVTGICAALCVMPTMLRDGSYRRLAEVAVAAAMLRFPACDKCAVLELLSCLI